MTQHLDGLPEEQREAALRRAKQLLTRSKRVALAHRRGSATSTALTMGVYKLMRDIVENPVVRRIAEDTK